MRKRKQEVTRGSGNVFADLQLENPEEHLLKSKLAMQIAAIISEERLTQSEAAARVDLDQPKISAIVRGRLDDFSVDRLLGVIRALDQRVEIVISPAKKGAIIVSRERRARRVNARGDKSDTRRPSAASSVR